MTLRDFSFHRHACYCYSVFHRFRHAKFANDGLILSSSQFLILPELPQKMKLTSKVVEIDPKIIVSLPKILIPETHCKRFRKKICVTQMLSNPL